MTPKEIAAALRELAPENYNAAGELVTALRELADILAPRKRADTVMKLTGETLDLGDRPIPEQLRAMAEVLREQSFINGEESAESETRAIADCAGFCDAIAAELEH